MSIEVIPEAYRQPFDPLADVDHDAVMQYTLGRLTTGRGVREELQSVYNVNGHHSPELVGRLINYGKFLEPFDDDLIAIDEDYPRIRVFNAGAALALATATSLAYELDVSQPAWRRHWVNLPDGVDAPMSITLNKDSTPDDCYKVGAALMQIGQRNLAQFEPPYQSLVREIDDEYVSGGEFSNILHASYGYVYGVARRVIHDVAYPQAVEAEVARALPDKNEPGMQTSLDKEYAALIESEAGNV
jgi:hypothetical protein